MIVCHCNVIACGEIREAVHRIKQQDRHGVVTPGRVFSRCGKRPNCGGCMPLISSMIAELVVESGPARTVIQGAEVAGLVTAPEQAAPKDRDAA